MTIYYYYYGNLKTHKFLTLCSCRIVVQFGTVAMRHTSRRLLEGQQPRLCRECLGQTGDVNVLKSRKTNIKLSSSERNDTRESSCSRSNCQDVPFKSDSKSSEHKGNLFVCNKGKHSYLSTKGYLSVTCGTRLYIAQSFI